ncbi:MAG: LPXTG cell wall anchor domain-containing protein, partial [Clostridia bacterium]|nr:LPXTG cell wall anchor domain-containing protein [Clostridia bacterium]
DSIVNVQWGSAFTEEDQKTDFINGLKAMKVVDENNNEVESPFKSASRLKTAEDIAKVLSNYGDDSKVAKEFAKYTAKFAIENNLTRMEGTYKNGDTFTETGYYLFLDATETNDKEDVVANAVVSKMKANEAVNITVKVTVPTLEKKVKENTYNGNAASGINAAYGEYKYGEGYNDAADYCIGDEVPFELIGTMAEGMEYYDTYYYGFVDTLCKGLTFDADKADVKIYVYNPDPDANDEYVQTGDELVAAGKFTYTATVNADGTTNVVFECADILPITEINSKSRVVVNYDAVLNNAAVIGYDGNENKAYLEYSNNPLPTPGGTTPSKGKTPEDKVIVFTYSMDVNKIDKNTGAALDGAEFYLVNSQGKYYCKAAAADSLPYWGTDTDANVAKITPDSNNVFTVKGLDKGTYKLIEAKAPTNYRPLENPVVIDVNAVILPNVSDTAAQNWNDGDAHSALLAQGGNTLGYSVSKNDRVTPNSNDYVSVDGKKVTVSNEKTYILPGTGGEGTTLIYIIGGALIVAAAGLFIVKRRSSK